MELEFEYLDTDILLGLNIELLKNNCSLCCICGMNEKEENESLTEYWDKYKLPCGHITHTRCCRNYIIKCDKTLKCPYRCDIKRPYKPWYYYKYIKNKKQI